MAQVTLRNVLQVRGLSDSVQRLKSEIEEHHRIVGSSFQIRHVVERIERVAPTAPPEKSIVALRRTQGGPELRRPVAAR